MSGSSFPCRPFFLLLFFLGLKMLELPPTGAYPRKVVILLLISDLDPSGLAISDSIDACMMAVGSTSWIFSNCRPICLT